MSAINEMKLKIFPLFFFIFINFVTWSLCFMLFHIFPNKISKYVKATKYFIKRGQITLRRGTQISLMSFTVDSLNTATNCFDFYLQPLQKEISHWLSYVDLKNSFSNWNQQLVEINLLLMPYSHMKEKLTKMEQL